ncbi:hypothetical protein [Streptomyces sp. NPDC001568]|uniref:hypothetical protein n=1 Tax=Streptomyces sp. NPDC001568 TaxID=3364588 RepID=UPI0036854FFC
MPDDTTRTAWIVLGGIHLLNRTAPRQDGDPIVLIRVTAQEVSFPTTTVIVRWAFLGTCPATALTTRGIPLGETRIEGGELFPDAIAGPTLGALVGAAAAPGLVPMFYLAEDPTGGFHTYAQVRFYAEDACFIRITPEPIGHGPADALTWLEPAMAERAKSAPQLDNHLR